MVLKSKSKPVPWMFLPSQSRVAQFLHRGIHARDGIRILRADVEHADLRAAEPAGDHHAKQDGVRLLLHEVLVDVGAGITFVRIADDVLHRARRRRGTIAT